MRIHSPGCVLAGLLLLVSSGVLADVDPRAESERKIKAAQVVEALGPNLAGDSTSLYTGSTSFTAVDVSVPGSNDLPVAVGRSYVVQLNANEASSGGSLVPFLRAFGDWDLDIPFLSGVYSDQLGWEIDSTTPTQRCSILGQIKSDGSSASGNPRHYPVSAPIWWPGEFWSGIDLNIPGTGKQSLLVANQPGVVKPALGGPYHWTTKNDWWLSCLPASAGNTGGEGFLALGPTGVKYTFDRMSSRPVSRLADQLCPAGGAQTPGEAAQVRHTLPAGDGDSNQAVDRCISRKIARREFFLLPSRVEDRFGNWVAYLYSTDSFARLISVTGSDDRRIALSYNAEGFVDTISDGVRTWTYRYDNGSLVQVLLPDGSSWRYDFSGMKMISSFPQTCADIGEIDTCLAPPVTSGSAEGHVVHPSGGRTDFVFATHFKPNSGAESSASYPLALVSKSISGPGLAPAMWSFSYWPSRDAFVASCSAAGGCWQETVVDAMSPDGRVVRTTFGTERLVNQGLQISDQAGTMVNGTPVFLKKVALTYTVPGQLDGFAMVQGSNPMTHGGGISPDGVFYSERKLPVKKQVTSLQGVDFTWQANAFDSFSRPISVSRFSTLGPSRSESTTYYDDRTRWVLGQVASVTDQATGKVVSRTDFDSVSALPVRSYSFGLLLQSMSYNSDGTLASLRDGLGHVSTLGGWYRGVPRSIAYPDGATERATVNPTGTIADRTDELGNLTAYTYDPLGRLAGLTYPTGDGVEWNGSSRVFAPVPTPEYGLASGHWKLTTNTGNARTTTFYDGLWRPVLNLTEGVGDAATRSFQVRRFDPAGREIFSSYPVASLVDVGEALTGVSTVYDGLGRVTRVNGNSELGQLVSSIEYLDGFRTRTTNPRGFSTVTSYQVFDSPDTSLPLLIQSPEGVTTTIARDGFGKPTRISRSGN